MSVEYYEDVNMEREIVDKWIEALLDDVYEDRSSAIHITDLTNPCMANVRYVKERQKRKEDAYTYGFITKVWSGKKLHETAFGDEHEYAFRIKIAKEEPYNYIYGSMDEIVDGVVIDKKFYGFIPKEPYHHHVEQVMYYIGALNGKHEHILEDGRIVEGEIKEYDRGAIMYIDRKTLRVKLFFFKVENPKEVRDEMIEKAKKLRECLITGDCERVYSWMCNYCDWREECPIYKKMNGGENNESE